MKDNNDKFLIYTKIKAKGLKNLWKEKLLEIAKEQGLLVYQRKLDSTKSKWIYEKFY